MFNIPKHLSEDLKPYIKSIPEEKYNFYSHGISFIAAIIGSIYLIFIASKNAISNDVFPIIIYSFTLMFAYFFSTYYHSKYDLIEKKKSRTLDHIGIYFLIAGSYTPFLMIHLDNQKSTIILIILWLMVLIGSIFKYFFTHKFKVVSTLAYLIMGWLAIFIYTDLVANLSKESLFLIQLGGACYTLGAAFYLWKSLYLNHFIWHLFVSAGSIAHFISVYISIA